MESGKSLPTGIHFRLCDRDNVDASAFSIGNLASPHAAFKALMAVEGFVVIKAYNTVETIANIATT